MVAVKETFAKGKEESQIQNDGNRNGSTVRQIAACLIACLACSSSGIIMGYSSVGLVSMKNDENIELTDENASWIAGISSIGGAIGSLTTGYIMRRYGRRFTLIYYCLMSCLAGWILTAAAKPLAQVIGQQNVALPIIAGRFLGGITMGSSMSAASVYIIESVSHDLIERLGPLTLLARSSSFSLAVVIGALLDWFTFAVVAASVLIPFMIMTSFLPETPVWLVTFKKDINGAKRSLLKLRGRGFNPDNETIFQGQESNVDDKESSPAQCSPSINWKEFTKMTAVSTGLMIGVQVSGCGVLGAYLVQIITEIDSSINAYAWGICITVIIMVAPIFTVILTKWFSSKTILLWSSAAFTVALYVFATHFYLVERGYGGSPIWVPLCAINLYCAFFGIGYGSLLYSVATAILPPNGRDLGSSIAVTTTWILSFVTIKSFFLMKAYMGMSGLWYFYAICSTVLLVFMYVCIPKNIVNTKSH